MADGEKKQITFTLKQVVTGIIIFLAVVWGGKALFRTGVNYIRGQVREEVVSVISDLSNGKIDINAIKGKKIPFLTGDAE